MQEAWQQPNAGSSKAGLCKPVVGSKLTRARKTKKGSTEGPTFKLSKSLSGKDRDSGKGRGYSGRGRIPRAKPGLK